MIKNKKSIAVMLAVASAVSLVSLNKSMPVYAESQYNRELSNKLSTADSYTRTDKNGVSWVFSLNDDGTAFIKGATNVVSDTLEVPQEIDGCTVVGILNILEGRARDQSSQVEKVVLPSTIKYIGQSSLKELTNLKDINIPAGVEYFGFLAFPDNWINSHKDSNGFVIINNILVDGHNCSGNITIPSNVTVIGCNAFGVSYKHGSFAHYQGITGVKIPSNVKIIDDEAFYGCKDLKYADMAEGIEEIGGAAFKDCNSLENVKIPKSIKKLDNSAFAGCNSIKIETADKTSNDDSKGLVISADGILLNGKEAEGDVVIPSNVKEIQAEAFQNNDKVKSIKISGNTKVIKERAFLGCKNLKKVELEEGVNSIGTLAFSGTDISSLYLPDSVQAVGDKAFSACKNLNEASIGKNKPSGIEDAFLQCLNVTFREYDDKNSDTDDSSTDYNSDKLEITNDGILTNGKDAKGDVEIPSNVKEIQKEAFKGNTKITSIKIPSSVEKIGDEAFYQCSNLKKIKFSKGLIRIGDRAFSKIKISSMYLPDGLERLGKDAFEGCSELKDVSVSSTPPLGVDTVFVNCLKINYRGTVSDNKPTGTVSDWQCIDGKWYYINADGSKQKGWFFDIRYGKWYFLDENDGVRQTGWKYYAPYNSWFYLDPYDGARISGWFYDPSYGSWFFMNDNGTMKVGWMYDYNYGAWFYLNGNGTMRTGWFYDNSDGHWYYLYSNGVMARNTRVGGYYLNSSGAWVN